MVARNERMPPEDSQIPPVDLDGIEDGRPWMQFVWPVGSWDRCGTRARQFRMNADPITPGTVSVEVTLDDGEVVAAMIRTADLMRFVAHAVAATGDTYDPSR
jgi:hypothetical protein